MYVESVQLRSRALLVESSAYLERKRRTRDAVHGRRQLVRVAAVLERDFFVQWNRRALGRFVHAGDLLRHPARDHAVVVRGNSKSFGSESFAQSERSTAAVGFHISQKVGELTGRRDHSDKCVVLGRGTNHGGAPNVDIFNTNIKRLSTSNSGFEGVEIGDLQMAKP